MGNPDGTVLDLELVKSYDPLLHKNLKFLKRCSLEEIETLDLDFTVMTDNFGVTEVRNEFLTEKKLFLFTDNFGMTEVRN